MDKQTVIDRLKKAMEQGGWTRDIHDSPGTVFHGYLVITLFTLEGIDEYYEEPDLIGAIDIEALEKRLEALFQTTGGSIVGSAANSYNGHQINLCIDHKNITDKQLKKIERNIGSFYWSVIKPHITAKPFQA